MAWWHGIFAQVIAQVEQDQHIKDKFKNIVVIQMCSLVPDLNAAALRFDGRDKNVSKSVRINAGPKPVIVLRGRHVSHVKGEAHFNTYCEDIETKITQCIAAHKEDEEDKEDEVEV